MNIENFLLYDLKENKSCVFFFLFELSVYLILYVFN